MSLSQVAGPSSLVPLDPFPGLTYVVNRGVWNDRLGGLVGLTTAGSTYPGEVVIVKPDGAVARVGRRGQSFGGIGWSFDDLMHLRASAPVGLAQVNAPALDQHAFNANDHGLTDFAVLPDRFLQFDGHDVIAWPLGAGLGVAETHIRGAGAGGGTGRIFPADFTIGRSWWWLADVGDGTIYLYDAVARAEVSGRRTGLGIAAVAPSYSRKHDLFFAIDGASQLRVWANEPQASAISPPVFDSGPVAGHRHTVAAQVVGDLGEFCVGRAVTFGVSAGDLPQPTVLTDSIGIARTFYHAPFNPGAGYVATATLVE